MQRIIQAPPFMPPSSFPGLPPGPPQMPAAPRQGQGTPAAAPVPMPYTPGLAPYAQMPPAYIPGSAPLAQMPPAFAPAPPAFTQMPQAYGPGQAMGMMGQPMGSMGQPMGGAGQMPSINPQDLFRMLQGLAAPPAPNPSRGWTAGREESSQD